MSIGVSQEDTMLGRSCLLTSHHFLKGKGGGVCTRGGREEGGREEEREGGGREEGRRRERVREGGRGSDNSKGSMNWCVSICRCECVHMYFSQVTCTHSTRIISAGGILSMVRRERMKEIPNLEGTFHRGYHVRVSFWQFWLHQWRCRVD